MLDIAQNLSQVRARIASAELKFLRPAGSVTLIAVSKTKSAAALQAAIELGQVCFGESYVQEAVEKIRQLENPALEWHFIGPIQSNKTKLIAENFSWVHSIDRLKVAQRLSEQRPNVLPPLKVCLQVNISEEPSKSGVNVAELMDLVESVRQLPGLSLKGLMAIPQWQETFEAQRMPFRALRLLLDKINMEKGLALDVLSMGMSDDLEAAIAEGATHVRVGTDIFGEREYRVKG